MPDLRGRTELLTPAESATADALAAASGIPGIELMENAGRAAARAIMARLPPKPTLVACGPGNNGGDGYVVARYLQNAGWPVTVAALASSRDGTDAARAAGRWSGPVAEFASSASRRAELVIDAVFGAGLSRDVGGVVPAVLGAAHQIVAIDVPSGLDGATGQVRGFAPRAAMTVTFFRLKPGHLLMPGRELCGELVLADIGLPASVLGRVAPRLWVDHPSGWSLPVPKRGGHKFDRGIVTIVGGAVMTGATRLAAQAARRAGAGLVTIAASGGAGLIYRSGDAGAIVTEETVSTLLTDKRRTVWVCGPGLGLAAARETLPHLLASGRSVVVDADGLSAFAGAPDMLRGAAVLTPHSGEYDRVFGPVREDRVAAARRAATRTGAVVLLKGADTVIAAPDGRAAINASAPPWLATAGAGDVLAGLIAGLLAQGMAAWQAACAAAWLHGRAASIAGPGMVAEDLLPLIAAARRDADAPIRSAVGLR